MRKILLLTAFAAMALLFACNKNNPDTPAADDGNGARSGDDKEKVQPEWTKSDNFILIQLGKASNTLGCTMADLAGLEQDGWAITDEFTYIHLERNIDNVDVVMNCYLKGDTIFHTTCGLSPNAGSPLSSLSYIKEAVSTLSSQCMLTTGEICDFQMLKCHDITSYEENFVYSYGEALSSISCDTLNYGIVWADKESRDYDELSDCLWFGSATGLNIGFYRLSEGAWIVSMEVASRKYSGKK